MTAPAAGGLPARWGASVRVVAGVPLLDLSDLATSLGVSRRWLRGQVLEAGLPLTPVGRRSYLRPDDVREWIVSWWEDR